MFEKVNPAHPDKVADRIAGAIVDMAYRLCPKSQGNPSIAVEVLIGHGQCTIIIETNLGSYIDEHHLDEIRAHVRRISNEQNIRIDINIQEQDSALQHNQLDMIRCGDNGIFRGFPENNEEIHLTKLANKLYQEYRSDGKYIYDSGIDRLIVCQSNADSKDKIRQYWLDTLPGSIARIEFNPLGNWVGGINVDTGATNRKLGSDMGRAVTGGGLHGKDLSKADVSVNIYAYLKACMSGREYHVSCAIGDECVDGMLYSEIVEIARWYIDQIGGFEKFAEWGLIRPDDLFIDRLKKMKG